MSAHVNEFTAWDGSLTSAMGGAPTTLVEGLGRRIRGATGRLPALGRTTSPDLQGLFPQGGFDLIWPTARTPPSTWTGQPFCRWTWPSSEPMRSRVRP